MLLREASKEYKWTLNNSGIALMWRGGCIIRSVFLGNIKNAYAKNQALENSSQVGHHEMRGKLAPCCLPCRHGRYPCSRLLHRLIIL